MPADLLQPQRPGVDVSSASSKDTITGFENAKGGNAGDLFYGNSNANLLEGNGGNDFLLGFGGNDTIIGGAGVDRIAGGAGKDVLTGGADADAFYLLAITDSGLTKATRDLVTDFQDTLDKVDVSKIDADTTNDAIGRQRHVHLHKHRQLNDPCLVFTGTAGELRSYWTASGHIIEGDVNGDSKADFSIEVIDPTHAITLTSADFVL